MPRRSRANAAWCIPSAARRSTTTTSARSSSRCRQPLSSRIPYQIPTIGWPSDIEGWKVTDLQDYYRQYYAPNNAVMFIVGDIEPEAAFKLADQYLASIPAQPAPPAVTTKEPPQLGERRLRIERDAQTPLIAMAWHTAAAADREARVMEVLLSILGRRRFVAALPAARREGAGRGRRRHAVRRRLRSGPRLGLCRRAAGRRRDAHREADRRRDRAAGAGRPDGHRNHQGPQPGAGRLLARARNHQRQGAGARPVRSIPWRLPQALRRAVRVREHHRRRREGCGCEGAAPGKPHGRRARAQGRTDRRRPREVRSEPSFRHALARAVSAHCCRWRWPWAPKA